MRKDYYEILGIKPTQNREEVKKAFRKGVIQEHPDKNNGKESSKFLLINEIWKFLGDQKNLEAYYNYVANKGPAPRQSSKETPTTYQAGSNIVTQVDSNKLNTQVLADVGARVKVYIPFFVEINPKGSANKVVLLKEMSYNKNPILKTIKNNPALKRNKPSNQIPFEMLEYRDNINYAAIAQQVSDYATYIMTTENMFERELFQVGLDEKEAQQLVSEIFNLTINEKTSPSDLIIITAEVRLIDLDPRISEKGYYGEQYHGSSEEYFTLKPRVKIEAHDIISITFNCRALAVAYENQAWGKRFTIENTQQELTSDPSEICKAEVKAFINNNSFWDEIGKAAAEGKSSNVATPLAPIKLLQDAVGKSDCNLADIQQIAGNYIANKGNNSATQRLFFLKAAPASNSPPFIDAFMHEIASAKKWEELLYWIEVNKKAPQYLLALPSTTLNNKNAFDHQVEIEIKNDQEKALKWFETLGSYKVYNVIFEVGKLSHDLKVKCNPDNFKTFETLINRFTAFFTLHHLLIHKDQDKYYEEVYKAFVTVLEKLHQAEPLEYKKILNTHIFSNRSPWKIAGITVPKPHPLWKAFDALKDIQNGIVCQIVTEYFDYIHHIKEWKGTNTSEKESQFIEKLNAIEGLKPHPTQLLQLPAGERQLMIEYTPSRTTKTASRN